jgi:hypothetical protein
VGLAEGHEAGLAEGKTAGKAEAILAVLAARGIPVHSKVRKRIVAYRDAATLDR